MIIHGDQDASMIPGHMNFGKYILQQILKRRLDDVFLEKYDSGEKLTTLNFIQYAVNLSAGLTELGVKRGDIVAVAGEKRITYAPTTLAVIMTGAAYTPFELQIGDAVLIHTLNLTKPNYIICTELFWKSYSNIIKGSPFIKMVIGVEDIDDVELSVASLMSRHVELESFEPAPVQGHVDVALIIYSSGTTGLPKAVQITHLSLIFKSIPYEFDDVSSKTAIISACWNHGYDIFMTYKCLISGVKVVYVETLTSESFLKTIEGKQVDLAFIVPSFVEYLAKDKKVDEYAISSLIKITSFGSPLPSLFIEMVKKRLTNIKYVVQDYGTTEIGIVASGNWATKGPKPGSVGKAAPGVSLKIVDTKTRKTLGPNQRGEVCVRSPTSMKNYIGIEESTYLDEEGFFLTGDLGYYDEDRYLYIVDRLKDMICYNGEEVAPLDLENIIKQHPAVLGAGAVGVPAGTFGELPAAIVVRRPSCSLTEQELVDYVAKQASPCMHLRGGLKFVSELPTNLRGKILRRRLREMLQDK